jgi:hypothetical protein
VSNYQDRLLGRYDALGGPFHQLIPHKERLATAQRLASTVVRRVAMYWPTQTQNPHFSARTPPVSVFATPTESPAGIQNISYRACVPVQTSVGFRIRYDIEWGNSRTIFQPGGPMNLQRGARLITAWMLAFAFRGAFRGRMRIPAICACILIDYRETPSFYL